MHITHFNSALLEKVGIDSTLLGMMYSNQKVGSFSLVNVGTQVPDPLDTMNPIHRKRIGMQNGLPIYKHNDRSLHFLCACQSLFCPVSIILYVGILKLYIHLKSENSALGVCMASLYQ